MNYLNIKLTVLRSAEYIGSKPNARATWLSVSGYCADQENGGRIKDCNGWDLMQWAQTCGVYRKEIDAAAPLLVWDGDDLLVFGYPAEQEGVVKAKREGGAAGGRARAEKLQEGQPAAQEQPTARPASPDKAPPAPAPAAASHGGAKRAVKVNGYNDIMNPANDVVELCSAITGDSSDRARGFWRKVQSVIGPEQIRSQLCTLWGEMQSNERPHNPAAVLTGKLKQLMDRRAG